MLAKTQSVALIGTEAHLVTVEVDVASGGLPSFTIVGLPAKSVKEAEQRTRSALEASGHDWPLRRKVANLAPGILRKEGTHFDLPIAVGLLAATSELDQSRLDNWVFLGELALDGSIRPVRGALPAAIKCREAGRRGLICPAANAAEAALIEGIDIVPVDSLRQCVAFLRGNWSPPPCERASSRPAQSIDHDMRDVRGHPEAKDAMVIAAAGGHNVLACETVTPV